MTLVYYEVIIHHHFIHTLRQVALENVKQKKNETSKYCRVIRR
jgi:hypothetical protein